MRTLHDGKGRSHHHVAKQKSEDQARRPLAIIAFRNRVAAMCKAEVATEDAVKGDKESNGLLENAIMLLRGFEQSSATLKSRMQEPLNDDSLVMPWLVEDAGCIPSRCQKGRDGKTPF